MANAERIAFDALIESVVEGTPIDWSAVEAQVTTDAERTRFHNLRLVARIADLQRTFAALDDQALDESWAPPQLPERLPPPERWGHLIVGSLIGRGAYSEVYRARDPQLDVDVALKVLHGAATVPEDIERLLTEPRALAQVRHANVVTVLGASTSDGRAGLWMELVDGRTLKENQSEHERLTAKETVEIGIEICRALAAVHTTGLVHGDVKAQNVMLAARPRRRVVLMDFGSGRPVGGGTATVGGTPLYAAPEVLAGSPPAVASDIYSLGVLLFHLLTNRYPYEAEDLDGLRLAHADGQRQRLRELRPGLPAALVEVIEQALADDPAARFISASDLEVALARSVGLAPRPWSRTTTVMLASAAVLGVAMVVGQAWASHPGAPATPLVAVLPFTSGGTSASPAFAVGLSDEIARTLQQYNLPVKLITAEPTPEVTQQLADAGVNELRGAVTREGKLTQVRAWLIDQRQRVRWSRTYTAWQDDLPVLKASIAGDLATVLKVGPKSGPTPTARHAPLGAAYDEYIAGRAKWYRRSSGSIKDALEHFNRAVHLDAEYAEAWSGISDANLTLGINAFGSLAPAEARRRAKGPALKALQLGENLAEVQTSLAFAAYLQDWDWVAAEEHFKRAIALNGQYGLAHQWYSDFLTAMGRTEDARFEIDEAWRLEPMSILIERDRAWGPFMTGHYEEAVAYLRPVVEANESFAPARTLLARCLTELGQYDEARTLLAATNMPARTRGVFTAYVQASSGDLAGARRLMQEVEIDRNDDYLSPYYIAIAYNALRDQATTLKWLARAQKEQDPMMVNMRTDFRLRNLRTEPEFQRILNVMNFPPY